jgi:type II secretory pathway pseudopilin PulG
LSGAVRLPIKTRVRERAREEQGFGLVELLIAITLLAVGVLAIASAFSAGVLTIRRASRTTTAAALADAQLELYRAVTYPAIYLDTASEAATDSTYKSDPALSGTPSKVLASCPGVPDECNPSRIASGADGGRYRVDTYILYVTPLQGRQLKQVTVVVREPSNVGGQPLTRVVSTFDAVTGS